MKVGVIGTGLMGRDHVLALKRFSAFQDVEMTAAADMVEENRQKTSEVWPNARLYKDGYELLKNEKLDAVHICLPSFLHTDMAIAAMEAGLHVLLEKPACLSERDCERLLEVKNRTGVKVMVGQVLRFFPEYQFLKEVYDKGTYGKLKGLVMQRLSQNVLWGYQDWFHDEEKSGSVILDLHIHDADFIRYLLGEPEGIHVRATAYENGMINQVLTQYDYPGLLVSAEGLWDITPKWPFTASFRAYFENATISFNGREKPSVKVYLPDGSIQEPEFEKVPELGGYYTEVEYFYGCLLRGEEPSRASLEEGIKTVQLMLREQAAAHLFLEGGK